MSGSFACKTYDVNIKWFISDQDSFVGPLLRSFVGPLLRSGLETDELGLKTAELGCTPSSSFLTASGAGRRRFGGGGGGGG